MTKILFSTLFGSRLYGTNTPTSDVDIKEVVLPNIDDLLIGKGCKNKVFSTGSYHSRNTKDDIDREEIPIQVFAKDFLGGQTYALELAFSILAYEHKADQKIYSQDIVVFTQELVDNFLTSNVKAMTGYALNQAQIYGIKGNRLGSIRKLVEKLADEILMLPHDSKETLAILEPWVLDNSDQYIFMSTYENNNKVHPAIAVFEKNYPLTMPIREAFDRLKRTMSKYGSRATEAESAKGIDWKATSHAVRIVMQANELLENGKLTFPFDEKEKALILRIKAGKSTIQEVQFILEELLRKLEELKLTTSLQPNSPELSKKLEDWLKTWMRHFYL